MYRPRISIIINSYNYAKYVGQTIDSALAQDYANKEIIVIDDGSSDNSADIIKGYSDRVTAIFQPNQGQIKACFRAMSVADGDYICFLDSDDYLLPGALSAIAGMCTPDVAKVQFQLTPVGPDNEILGRPFPRMTQMDRAELIAQINRRGSYVTPPNSGNVYRKDTFSYIDAIDYEPSIDGIPYLISPFIGEVRQIAQPLGCYRYHAHNYSEHGLLRTDRFKTEYQRFSGRLLHLGRIADRNHFEGLAITDLDRYAYVRSRKMLEIISSGKAPSLQMAAKYCAALLKEHEPLQRLLQLSAWAIAVCIVPDKARKWLALYLTYPLARHRKARQVAPQSQPVGLHAAAHLQEGPQLFPNPGDQAASL